MGIKKHFAADEWVDFARGLITGAKRASMEAHRAGCVRCRRASDIMGRLAQAAEADAAYQAPGDLMRWARAIHPRRPPEKALGGARILARRLYDSFRDPLPAGLRSASHARQALFEAGDFALDLSVDRERGSRRMILVGQIVDRNDPEKPLADVPVLLVRGTHVAARGVSNQRGEFHLEYDPGEGLRIQIPVGGDRKIELPLPWFRQTGSR